MRRLRVFNSVSLDGYFTDSKGDISWAHRRDPEFDEFVSSNAQGGGVLVFGRVTYDMMVSYWPTEEAMKNMPEVARGMNDAQKIVFSRSMQKASWKNTRVINGDIAAEMRRLKGESGPDMVILGSGSIVAQLSDARLIDSYQLVMNPIALGAGRTMFERMEQPLNFKLCDTRTFQNGNVVLEYDLAG